MTRTDFSALGMMPRRASIEEARIRAMGRELHFWITVKTYQCPDPDHPQIPVGPEYHIADNGPVCLWCGEAYDIVIKNSVCLGQWDRGAMRA